MLLYFCSFTTFSEESSVAHKRIILQKCFSMSQKHFQVSKNIFHRLENFSKFPKTFFIASKTLQSLQKRFSSSRKLFEVPRNVFRHLENLFPFYFPSYRCHQQGHEGADDVEEAVWEISERGNTEDGGLGHAAGVPRNENRGDGGDILCRAAEEA